MNIKNPLKKIFQIYSLLLGILGLYLLITFGTGALKFIYNNEYYMLVDFAPVLIAAAILIYVSFKSILSPSRKLLIAISIITGVIIFLATNRIALDLIMELKITSTKAQAFLLNVCPLILGFFSYLLLKIVLLKSNRMNKLIQP